MAKNRILGEIAALPGRAWKATRGLGHRVVGEMSRLRQSRWPWRGTSGGRHTTTYEVDSSQIDYRLARRLYNNELDEYKLGGWAPKPIINTAVGFMGVPSFRSEDEEAQEVLDEFFGGNVSQMQQTERDALRDGDSWAWITREEIADKDLYPESDGHRLVYNLIPPEQIHQIIRDFSGRPIEYVLKSTHEWTDADGQTRKGIVTQYITADYRRIEVEGDEPEGVEVGEHPNPWGFIPIVQFSNERDSSATNGRSDLEAVEPFIKAYHDVMTHAMQGNKLHSTPKLKLKLNKVSRFLKNNFGIEDPAEFARQGKKIELDGHDIILLEENEDAGFIEAQSATGSAEPLLKFLFRCIVDVSETPEFAFGAATASSHASVKEQMPVLIRRIARKRLGFEDSWQQLARIVLTMTSISTGRRFSTHATEILWDPVQERDEAEAAKTLSSVVSALVEAVSHNLMSLESAVNYLASFVESMREWESDEGEGEKDRIIRTAVMRARMDGTGDEDDEGLEAILNRLAGDR